MPRKTPHIHYIYKTTCNFNQKYYIGMHSTSNLEDGYMGSGKRLRYSIRKYGKDNHTKIILEFLPNRESLKEREVEIVNSDLLLEEKCMNLKPGGYGGGKFYSEEHKFKCSKSGNEMFLKKMMDEQYRKDFSKKLSDAYKKQLLEGKREKKYFYDWNGKTHTDETKQKLSEKKKGTGVGVTNSQYGTCWITKNNENKKIKKTDINQYLYDGWVRGRNTSITEKITKV